MMKIIWRAIRLKIILRSLVIADFMLEDVMLVGTIMEGLIVLIGSILDEIKAALVA